MGNRYWDTEAIYRDILRMMSQYKCGVLTECDDDLGGDIEPYKH